MHAAQGALFAVPRRAALRPGRGQPGGSESLLFEGPREQTAIVGAHIDGHDHRAGHICRVEFHVDRQGRMVRHGYGNDELAAPFADGGHLLGDFIFDVPGQNQDVVRLGFGDALGRMRSGSACPAESGPACEGSDRRYSESAPAQRRNN